MLRLLTFRCAPVAFLSEDALDEPLEGPIRIIGVDRVSDGFVRSIYPGVCIERRLCCQRSMDTPAQLLEPVFGSHPS